MSTPTGQISANNVENTLNEGLSTNYPSGTSKLTFNDGLVRTLASKPSGAISMNDMRGKAGPLPVNTLIRTTTCSGSSMGTIVADGKYGEKVGDPIPNSSLCGTVLSMTISSNTPNFDMHASAMALGWDGRTLLNFTVTINSGIFVYSNRSTAYAFYISPIFPFGTVLTITNNGGYIVGSSGSGGAGGIGANGNGVSGQPGGPALFAGYSVSIYNNGYIAGGGGGGGGGGSGKYFNQAIKVIVGTSGGNGGIGSGFNTSDIFVTATAGDAAGGSDSGAGGAGGDFGSIGSSGGNGRPTGLTPTLGGGGGAGGFAVTVINNVNWLKVGTVIGPTI